MRDAMRAWQDRLEETADLDGALSELDGGTGFEVEASRGRIRGFQAALDEADRHLKKAAQILSAEAVAPTVDNHYRGLMLAAWSRENDLMLGRISAKFVPSPEVLLPDAGLAQACHYHQMLDVAELLQIGELWEALSLCRRVASTRQTGPINGAFAFIALGICSHNVGFADECATSLETAELHARMITKRFGLLRVATRLESVFRQVGREADSAAWGSVVDRAPCPARTKAALRRRSGIVAERSQRCGVLHLV